MVIMRTAGKSKLSGFTLMDPDRLRLMLRGLAAPGAVAGIIGKMMKDEISGLGLNLTVISTGLELQVRAAAKWEKCWV